MSTPDQLRARLKAALTTAMKARDRDAASAIRSAIAAIDNAEAVVPQEPPVVGTGPIAGALTGLGAGEAARRELSADDIVEIIEAEIADLTASADDYDGLGQSDRAASLRTGAATLAIALGSD